MKIKGKLFAALALSVCMAFGATGLAACKPSEDEGSKTPNVDSAIMAVYNSYVASAEGNGEEPMSYDDWYADLLANAKGEKGDKGDKGDQGDQGDQGQDGKDGTNGKDGENGKDGAGWLVGEKEPTAEDGNNGDLYLDYSTWNVYHKVNGEWQLLGNIKGADGVGGEQESGGNKIKLGTVNITAGSTTTVPLTDVEAGYYTIKANLTSNLTTGRFQARIGTDGYLSELCYMDTEAVYLSFIRIDEGATIMTLLAIDEAVNGEVWLEKYEMPTVEVGGTYILPLNEYPGIATGDATTGKEFKAILGNSIVAGKTYTITIVPGIAIDQPTNRACINKNMTGYRVNITKTQGSGDLAVTADILNESGENYFFIVSATVNAQYLRVVPYIVTITEATA